MVDINWTKDQVINFFSAKRQSNNKITEEFLLNLEREEIDGEAFSLLFKEDVRKLGITNIGLQKTIIEYGEKNVIKLKENIKKDNIYIQVYKEDLNNIWNKIEEKIQKVKLGEKLKFIKYLLIRDPSPNLEPKEGFIQYLKKVLGENSDSIGIIEDNFDELLAIDLNELGLNLEDKRKVRIIIELLKQKECQNNNDGNNNAESVPTNNEVILHNDYEIYPLIKSYKYKTSQNEHSYGLLNPIDEFNKICEYFNIKGEDGINNINYDIAFKYELSTFMLWGSKEGLKKFFEDSNIKKAIEYFYPIKGKKEKEEKQAGIYLCIEKTDKIAYLIIWPGQYKYKYSNKEEPNNNLLVTLIRNGFSISNNSILSLSDKEIKDFDYNDYEIFRKNKGYEAKRGKGKKTDNDFKKIFRIENEKALKDGISKISDKIFVQSNIKQNYLLFHDLDTKNCESKLSEFKNNSTHICFEENFDCSPKILYNLLKNMEEKFDYIKNGLNDFIKMKMDQVLNSVCFTELLNKENINNIFKCKYCSNININIFDPSQIYISDTKEYFHKDCFINKEKNKKFNFKNIVETNIIYMEKLQLYEKYKKEILNSGEIFKTYIESFFTKCEKRFKKFEIKKEGGWWFEYYLPKLNIFSSSKNNYIIDEEVITDEYKKMKNNNYDDLIKNRNIIFQKEFKNYSSQSEGINNFSILHNWKTKMISRVNDYYKKNEKNIKKWIIVKSISNNSINYSECQIGRIYLYGISNRLNDNDELSILPDKVNSSIFKDHVIMDCYSGTNERDNFRIYQHIETNKYFFPKFNREFNGLYDFDSMSNTLITYNSETKKLAKFSNKNPSSSKTLENLFSDKIIKILLVPCEEKYDNQSALFFIEEKNNKTIKISLVNIVKGILNSKELFLSEKFKYENFEDFQFIIDVDFLLILLYNEKESKWKGKVFSLNSLNMEDPPFEEITEINLNSNKNSLFSLYKIKDKKYLLSYEIIEKKPNIIYWEIISKLTKNSFELTTGKSKEDDIKKFKPGNCIVNYIYHCFEKYYLISSIQYKKKINKQTKLNIYLGNKNSLKVPNFKAYIDELKQICEDNKKVKFSVINFSYFDNHKNLFSIKNSSLGEILLKVLEETPIQIAKIINDEFEIMSDWDTLDNKLSKNKEMNIQTYVKNIKFGIKESIFNFYSLLLSLFVVLGPNQ